jgi:hypothetical protein
MHTLRILDTKRIKALVNIENTKNKRRQRYWLNQAIIYQDRYFKLYLNNSVS